MCVHVHISLSIYKCIYIYMFSTCTLLVVSLSTYIYIYTHVYIYIYIDIHTYTARANGLACPPLSTAAGRRALEYSIMYGKFSKFKICFCGLDPGNLKFETVRTHEQPIFF